MDLVTIEEGVRGTYNRKVVATQYTIARDESKGHDQRSHPEKISNCDCYDDHQSTACAYCLMPDQKNKETRKQCKKRPEYRGYHNVDANAKNKNKT